MPLVINEVTASDAAGVDGVAGVAEAVRRHDWPEVPPLLPRMVALNLEHPFPGRHTELYLASYDGEPAGRLGLSFPVLDNLSNVFCELEVAPAFRRTGIGRGLLALAEERAPVRGRTRLMTDTAWDLPGRPARGGAGVTFARAAGFATALTDIQRRLDLDRLDEASLDGMLAEARARSAGYRLVQWRDSAPEEYVDDVAYLDSRLVEDAPMGDLKWEPEKVDADRIRQSEKVRAARGQYSFHTGAVHEETGRLVAWTAIGGDRALDWWAWQGITIVEPRHRGHRLGALVKVENLRSFRAAEPAMRAIDTFNAEENSYMISINERMGFRPLYAWQAWQRDL
jgi:GNAT superfamily N-acetyltransferase